MARLTRQIGINPVQINLPQTTSVGPALIKTAQGIASREFDKAADKRTQEAQVAAAAINFERDGDGNLVAPSLPIGANGLQAPSIYDRAYTNMVSTRYLQQIEIDTNERLNKIATDHRFDPSAYREVAEAYVKKVTELAPPLLKPDVNNNAQIRMVEHFNMLVRERAELDHLEAAAVHAQSIDGLYKDLAGYAVAGADPSITGAKMLQIRAAIVQGEALNFWNAAKSAELERQMDVRFATDTIVGEITRLADDPLEHAAAVDQLTKFALGEGTISMVDELGNVSKVPVEEIYPDPADRQFIADQGIGIIRAKEQGRAGYENERFSRQSDNFEHWFLPHALQQAKTGGELDLATIQSHYDKAAAANNQGLMKRTSDIMLGAYTTNGEGSETRAARRAAAAVQFHSQQRRNMLQGYLDRYGADSLEQLSDDQMREFEMVSRRYAGAIDIPQGPEMAEELDGAYNAMAMTHGGIHFEDPDVPLLKIEQWIKDGPAQIGVVTWDMSIPMNSMLQSGNKDQIDRALAIGRMMYREPLIAKNMSDPSALGRNGEALAYIFDNYSPGAIDAGRVTEILKQFSVPGWNPHLEWSAMGEDGRKKIMNKVADELDGRFIAMFPGPNQARVLSGGLFRPAVGGYPAEMEQAIFHEIRSRAGVMNPDREETYERHIDAAIDAVVRQQGWVLSELGWSESRFTEDNDLARYAHSKFAPEAFYRDAEGYIDREVMSEVWSDFQLHLDRLNAADPSLPLLAAGDNAFLEYNQAMSGYNAEGRFVPSYNIVGVDTNGRRTVMTSDRYTEGDQFTINFELSYKTGTENRMKRLRAEQERKAAARLEQQSYQFVNPGKQQ